MTLLVPQSSANCPQLFFFLPDSFQKNLSTILNKLVSQCFEDILNEFVNPKPWPSLTYRSCLLFHNSKHYDTHAGSHLIPAPWLVQIDARAGVHKKIYPELRLVGGILSLFNVTINQKTTASSVYFWTSNHCTPASSQTHALYEFLEAGQSLED